MMAGMLKRVAPLSYEAWIDYDVCGTHVSRAELEALRALVGVEGDGLAAASGARLDRAALEAARPRQARDRRAARQAGAAARRRPTSSWTCRAARSAEHFAERFAAAVPSARSRPSSGPSPDPLSRQTAASRGRGREGRSAR